MTRCAVCGLLRDSLAHSNQDWNTHPFDPAISSAEVRARMEVLNSLRVQSEYDRGRFDAFAELVEEAERG